MTEADTLRACREIVTRFMTHEIEREEAFEEVIVALEAGGFGSVASVDDVANEE